MAREHAKIRLDIWADGEWRELDVECQHLYLLLLSHPTLSYVGVADWRPGRIAQLAKDLTADRVRAAAARLEALRFILTDDESEEVLIRSFVKHDGLLKQPKMAVSMANAFGATASNPIREVIAFEVQKLRERDSDLAAWRVSQVQTVLDAKASPIETFTHGVTPGFTPAVTPNPARPQGLPTSTATSTATSTSRSAPSARELEPRFNEAWAHWPKKTERKKSLEKFVAKSRVRPVDDLVADIRRFGDAYAATTEKRFVPALNVWLNGERWTDELPGAELARPGGKPKKVFKAHAD